MIVVVVVVPGSPGSPGEVADSRTEVHLISSCVGEDLVSCTQLRCQVRDGFKELVQAAGDAFP